MDTKTIENAIQQEIATKVISNLPDEQKNIIIAEAIKRILTKDLFIDWEVKKMLNQYGLAYAYEYVQNPEIQNNLKEKAISVVNDVMDGVIKVIGKAIEDDIKSQYTRIFSERSYGDK